MISRGKPQSTNVRTQIQDDKAMRGDEIGREDSGKIGKKQSHHHTGKDKIRWRIKGEKLLHRILYWKPRVEI